MVACTRRRLIGAALIGLCGASLIERQVAAHEVPAHQLITDTAISYLVAHRPELKACGTTAVRTALKKGVKDEDNYIRWPIGHFFFHFLPRLSDLITFQAVGLEPRFGIAAGCDSIGRGFSSASCRGTIYPVNQDALAYLQRLPVPVSSFSATDPGIDPYDITIAFLESTVGNDKRDGWELLGHFLHLLQDLASPPHVHQDAHPHPDNIVGNYWLGLNGDPSEFEVVNKFRSIPATVVDQLPCQDPDGLPCVHDPADTFRELQQFTSTNFHSDKTAGNPALPPFKSADVGAYAVDASNRRLWRISGERFWIDDTIAMEQFDRLAPLAVRYTAAMFKFIHDYLYDLTGAGICDEELGVTVSGSGTVSSVRVGSAPLPNMPGAITDCGSSCVGRFASGKPATLKATAQAGQRFIGWSGACSGTGDCVVMMDEIDAKTVTAQFAPATDQCPTLTICGTVTDAETGTFFLHGIAVELRNTSGQILATAFTDTTGTFAFGSLTAPGYLLRLVGPTGTVPTPSQTSATPGGSPARFTLRGVPGGVTVSGVVLTFLLFTKVPWEGPPPCQGGGCPPGTPASFSHVISGISPDIIQVPNGTWWLTCYVPPTFAQRPSLQFIAAPQQSLTLSCPQ